MALGSIYNAYPNGRPSGLPTDIVDQLVQVKQYQLLTPIQTDIAEANARKDNYSNLNSKLVALYQIADTLSSSTTFNAKTITVNDSSILTATASSSAHSGTYSITISKVAKAHHLIIGVDDSNPSTGVTVGISDPDDASLIQDGVTISFYHNGKTYSYTTDSSTTLTNLADTITNDDNGVYASVTNIGSETSPQYVLSLLSEDTGSSTNQITTDEAGTTKGVTLSDTLFTTGATEQETVQTGEDAQLDIDGVTYTRSSNEITDIISGVTLNLLNTGTTTITVSLDTESIIENIQTLITAYNDFDSFMDENASYDLENKEAGPLLGDSIARGAQNSLRSIFSGIVPGTASNEYQYLSQIGIQFSDDGTLEFDRTSFEDALKNNPEDVEALFTGDDGVATRLKELLNYYTDSSQGVIPSTIKSIQDQLEDLNNRYTEAQEDLNEYEEQMVKKYAALEEAVLKYQAIQEQLDSYIDSWKNSFKA
jgi:flagellar hook-associated protein 2